CSGEPDLTGPPRSPTLSRGSSAPREGGFRNLAEPQETSSTPNAARGRTLELEGFGIARTAAFLLVLLVPGAALALDPSRAVTQYDTKTWFAKDGLPQNSVNGIVQTPDGYLWFA